MKALLRVPGFYTQILELWENNNLNTCEQFLYIFIPNTLEPREACERPYSGSKGKHAVVLVT